MENSKSPKINLTFKNKDGRVFNHVREIAYKKGELCNNIGKFVAQTRREKSIYFADEDMPGVYIYQNYVNPNIAYRIYSEFADYGFNGYRDDQLIESLAEKQESIKLSKFPTGVVTLEGMIIGQEIPYFENYVTLDEYSKMKQTNVNSVELSIRVLKILKEMYENGVLYFDNHSKNFMINPSKPNDQIEVIDFDSSYMNIEDIRQTHVNDFYRNFTFMVNALNKNSEVNNITGNFTLTNSFDEALEQLEGMSKKLIKK